MIFNTAYTGTILYILVIGILGQYTKLILVYWDSHTGILRQYIKLGDKVPAGVNMTFVSCALYDIDEDLAEFIDTMSCEPHDSQTQNTNL